MHHPRCVLCKLGWGGYVKTQLSLYLIYQADDMFRPMWAILRSQKYIMRKTIQSKIISFSRYSELSTRSRCNAVYIYMYYLLLYRVIVHIYVYVLFTLSTLVVEHIISSIGINRMTTRFR